MKYCCDRADILTRVTIGLTSDDQNLHGDRIKLWNDFNHAWLAMLQAQKDMMESGQQTQRSQSLIPQEGLERMGKELVRLCDSIERHGLVDYEYGVWEEQIIAGTSLRPLLPDVTDFAAFSSRRMP
jgi:hypothetical protein